MVSDARLSLLVNRYLDGQLSHEERSEFEGMLRHSATSREQFWQETRLHALLHEAERGAVPIEAVRPVARPRRNRFTMGMVAAAGVALVVLCGVWMWHAHAGQGAVERTTSAVAVLSRSVDAKWGSPEDARAVGDVLEPGWLHLTSGLAHVEFYNGVRLILEGPADLRVVSAGETHLGAGRVRVEVPPVARGFTVTTPRLRVVDLGTEFGVAVGAAQEEVHVFTGSVTLKTTSGIAQEVRAGEARAVVGDAEPYAIPPTPTAFAKAADLERKTVAAQDRRQQVWQQAAARWDADPALLVHFDFTKEAIADRTLRNRAIHGRAAGDGTIVGCTSVEGRWPGRHALGFHAESDRIRVRVPGEHHALTLVAWVRVDALPRPFNALFMSDAFAVGALHWQIRQDGSLHLAIAAPPGQRAERYNFDTPGIFAADRLGRWVQVGMVYDGPGRRMTHYVDGLPVGRYDLADDVPLRMGHGELGNWNPVDTKDGTPIRTLTGRMDGFALFSRALSEAEMDDLHRSGSAGITQE